MMNTYEVRFIAAVRFLEGPDEKELRATETIESIYVTVKARTPEQAVMTLGESLSRLVKES